MQTSTVRVRRYRKRRTVNQNPISLGKRGKLRRTRTAADRVRDYRLRLKQIFYGTLKDGDGSSNMEINELSQKNDQANFGNTSDNASYPSSSAKNRLRKLIKKPRTPLRWSQLEYFKVLDYIVQNGNYEKPTPEKFYTKLIKEMKLNASWQLVKYKMHNLKQTFLKAKNLYKEDNEPLIGQQDLMRKNILKICPYYDKLNIIFGDNQTKDDQLISIINIKSENCDHTAEDNDDAMDVITTDEHNIVPSLCQTDLNLSNNLATGNNWANASSLTGCENFNEFKSSQLNKELQLKKEKFNRKLKFKEKKFEMLFELKKRRIELIEMRIKKKYELKKLQLDQQERIAKYELDLKYKSTD